MDAGCGCRSSTGQWCRGGKVHLLRLRQDGLLRHPNLGTFGTDARRAHSRRSSKRAFPFRSSLCGVDVARH